MMAFCHFWNFLPLGVASFSTTPTLYSCLLGLKQTAALQYDRLSHPAQHGTAVEEISAETTRCSPFAGKEGSSRL